WSPDEQKRLIVTADADTGTPARRLAMRATFSPCSPSGIAHPRITSSISPASRPGVRRSASAITVAASSSGRVPRSVPFGALPTGVRTAETMTASVMPVSQQILERLGDLEELAVEQVIGGVDDHELLRIRRARVERLHVLEGTPFVALALDEELRLRARADGFEVVVRQRGADPYERRDARIGRAGVERDPGAE